MKEPIMHWLVRWAAMALSRFQVGKDHKTAYQRQTGKSCNVEVVPCAEKIWYRVAPTTGPKMSMESKWEEGLWLGHTRNSNEVFVGNKDGIVKAWAIRRRPLEERLDDAMVRSLKATPSGWNTDEAVTYEHPIIVESDGEPPSEEEEEEKYSHEVRVRVNDFKRHGLTHECPGCIRIRRGAKPPYRHNDACTTRMYDTIQRAAMSLSRFQIGKDRKTAHQRQTGRACSIEVQPLAEKRGTGSIQRQAPRRPWIPNGKKASG